MRCKLGRTRTTSNARCHQQLKLLAFDQNGEQVRQFISEIVEVPEDKIAEAGTNAVYFGKFEGRTGRAFSVAAVMLKSELFRGWRVCCAISGGNGDAAV